MTGSLRRAIRSVPHRASQTAMRRPHDVISGHSYHVPSKLSLVALTHGLTSRWGGYNGRQVASAVAESLRTTGGQGLCGRAHADRAPAVGLRCTHFGTRKMPSNVSAWRARLLLRRGPAPWLEEASASLGEDIPNISLSNIAFVALARMLLALLPSFAFLWLCNALPAAATVSSWIV